MILQTYLLQQTTAKQEKIWKQLAQFLSTRELYTVMKRIENGEDLYSAHQELGLINKYQVELLRICKQMNKDN